MTNGSRNAQAFNNKWIVTIKNHYKYSSKLKDWTIKNHSTPLSQKKKKSSREKKVKERELKADPKQKIRLKIVLMRCLWDEKGVEIESESSDVQGNGLKGLSDFKWKLHKLNNIVCNHSQKKKEWEMRLQMNTTFVNWIVNKLVKTRLYSFI